MEQTRTRTKKNIDRTRILNPRLLLNVIRFQLVLLLSADAQGQKFLVPDIVSVGGSFNITCNTKTFADFLSPQESTFTGVCALHIYRKTSSMSHFELIGHLLYYEKYGYIDHKDIPQYRNWTFKSVTSRTDNRNSMEVHLQVLDVECQDAGTYRCSMNYSFPDNSTRYKALTQTLTVEATVTEPILIADQGSSVADVLYFDNGAMVRLKCTVTGPQYLEIVWKREIKNSSSRKATTDKDVQYENYPVKSDITSANTERRYNQTDCRRFEYRSQLVLQVSEADVNRRYQCLVVLKGVDVASREVLFGLKSSENSTTGVVPDEPGITFETATGMIIGIVTAICVGLLLLLIAVGAVLYWKMSSPTSTSEEKPAPSPSDKAEKLEKEEKVEKVETVPSVSTTGSRLRRVSFSKEVEESGTSVA